MKIINLALTTDKLQIKLAGNVTATQLDWTCSFYDITTADGTVLEGASTGTTNNTTAVDICAAPATGHTRTVKSITVYNADSATAVPIILFNANGTVRVLARNSLTTLASWSTDDMSFYTDISSKLDKIGGTITGDTTIETKLTVGKAAGTTGSIDLKGTTSGIVTIKTADAAGTWTMTLPVDDGTASQYLQTNGNGVTSRQTVAAGGGVEPIRIRIPGELVVDASNSQGIFWRNVSGNTITISNIKIRVGKAAAGSGAAAAFNFYKSSGTDADGINTNAVNLFSSAIDLTTNYVDDTNVPNTTTVEDGRWISMRVTASAGATNKASDVEAIIIYS